MYNPSCQRQRPARRAHHRRGENEYAGQQDRRQPEQRRVSLQNARKNCCNRAENNASTIATNAKRNHVSAIRLLETRILASCGAGNSWPFPASCKIRTDERTGYSNSVRGTCHATPGFVLLPGLVAARAGRNAARVGIVHRRRETRAGPGPGPPQHRYDGRPADKTKGNLNIDEQRLLENSLTELRFCSSRFPAKWPRRRKPEWRLRSRSPCSAPAPAWACPPSAATAKSALRRTRATSAFARPFWSATGATTWSSTPAPTSATRPCAPASNASTPSFLPTPMPTTSWAWTT